MDKWDGKRRSLMYSLVVAIKCNSTSRKNKEKEAAEAAETTYLLLSSSLTNQIVVD